MKEYHKIETLFKRDIEGTKKLILNEFRDPAIEFIKELDWQWTEKVDGCLRWDTKLLQTNGEKITIKEIVDKKLPVEIYGFDGDNIVPTKVVGWHMNGLTDKWFVIKYDRRGLGVKGGNYYRTITCTGNHKFYVNGEYIRADELKIGDELSFMRTHQELSFVQQQIITGLLIGDGSASDEYRSIETSQKETSVDYIDWISDSLGSIAGSK